MIIPLTDLDNLLLELPKVEQALHAAAVADADAESDYKVESAKEILKADGTEKVKLALALVNTSAKFKTHLKARAEYEFLKEKIRDLRQAISARQSILSAEKESDKMHSQTAV